MQQKCIIKQAKAYCIGLVLGYITGNEILVDGGQWL